MTEKGTLTYGVAVEGVRHRDFELRLPTLEDVENALEEVPDGAHLARISRHIWARCLVSLGTLTREQITAELLGGLVDVEYGHFRAAEDALRKKLLAERDG